MTKSAILKVPQCKVEVKFVCKLHTPSLDQTLAEVDKWSLSF